MEDWEKPRSWIETGDTILVSDTDRVYSLIELYVMVHYWMPGKALVDDTGIYILFVDGNECRIDDLNDYWDNDFSLIAIREPNGYTTEAKNNLFEWWWNNNTKIAKGGVQNRYIDNLNDGKMRYFPAAQRTSPTPFITNDSNFALGNFVRYIDNELMARALRDYPNATGYTILHEVGLEGIYLIKEE